MSTVNETHESKHTKKLHCKGIYALYMHFSALDLNSDLALRGLMLDIRINPICTEL